MEFEYKKKQWRPPGKDDTSSDDEVKTETTSVVAKTPDTLGNTNMSMCLTELFTVRDKLFQKVGKSNVAKKKKKRSRARKGNNDDNQSSYSVGTENTNGTENTEMENLKMQQ